MTRFLWENNSKATKPTYATWCDMRQRCYNPSCPGYAQYGARGISICDRWRNDYDAFVTDMGFRPVGMSIERIDNNGNYEPSNCRWATSFEQSRNTRRTIKLTHQGQTKLMVDWATELGIHHHTVWERYNRGLPTEQTLEKGSLVPEPQHGTISMYVSRKCRCDPCRKANSDYARSLRQRRKLKGLQYDL